MAKKKQPPKKGDPNPPADKGAARAAAVTQAMAMAGFAPRPDQGPAHLEYRKSYVDDVGTRAVVTALINRGVAGMDFARLDGFVVTLQYNVHPSLDAVQRAPANLRPDMEALVKLLGSVHEADHVVSSVICEECGAAVAEFRLGPKNKIYCEACAQAQPDGDQMPEF